VLDAISRRSLSTEVLARLRQHILAQGLKPGDRLPTERALAAGLGVSRGTVREALKVLEVIGAVARCPRRGAVLQPVDFGVLAEVSRFLMIRTPADFSEVFVARRVLEVSVLPLAVAHASHEHFRRMDAANRLMEAEIEVAGSPVDGDMAFHRALLAAANNSSLEQFGEVIQEFFRDPRAHLFVDAEMARQTVEEHREIAEAIRAGDLPRAQRVLEKHLDRYVHRGLVQTSSPEESAEARHDVA